MCFHYLSDKKSISKLHNSTILHFAVKVLPPPAMTSQKYFFSLVQLTPYEYGFRGYLHFFCTIANKNSTTTFVTGGLCYKTREICHGVYIFVHPESFKNIIPLVVISFLSWDRGHLWNWQCHFNLKFNGIQYIFVCNAW